MSERRLAGVGPHLYDGTSGVAVFQAAYHALTGDPAARDQAVRSVAPLRAKVEQLAAAPEQAGRLSLAIGGFVGLGSFLYTFVRMARWLEDPALLDSAAQVVALITAERIQSDDRLDVMSGCAGTLLALLLFEREAPAAGSPRGRAFELAELCGQHLLDRRVSQGSRPRAWPGHDCPPISGFAHGAAGIAHALVRLFERNGREELRQAALEGLAFEHSLYDPETRTWLDPRFGRALAQAAWCHGVPGMALARMASLPATDTPAVRADLETMLSLTRSLPLDLRDHLCCGNLGRAEILETAGRTLRRPQLIEDAQELAAQVVARGAEAGFRFHAPEGEAELQPSLFLGLAGVGYVLLRLAHPGRLPSLLLLE